MRVTQIKHNLRFSYPAHAFRDKVKMYCHQNSISALIAHKCILWLMIIQNFECLSTVTDKRKLIK